MLSGTIILEDMALQFRVNPENAKVTYEVANMCTGEEETFTVDGPSFMTILGCTLSWCGECSGIKNYNELCAIVFPCENDNLRWFP